VLSYSVIRFNSPWGIRFPWTQLVFTRTINMASCFNSPWGIRFPWTIDMIAPNLMGYEVSIPLGELDFLGPGALVTGVMYMRFNSPWGIRFPWTSLSWFRRPELPQLSIPLGELDFLGQRYVLIGSGSIMPFNSPWGIRFPWTLPMRAIMFVMLIFQFPLGN